MRFRSALAVTACVLVLLTGCSGQQAAPTPTPTALTRAQAEKAAIATYRAYIAALNQVDYAQPATFEDIYRWESGDALAAEKKSLSQMHADKWTFHGEAKVDLVTVDPQGPPPTVDYVQLAVCLNINGVTVTDDSGAPVIPPEVQRIQSKAVAVRKSKVTATGYAIADFGARTGAPECT